MNITLSLAGGLGLFFFGNQLMSTSLQRIAGNKLKGMVRAFTVNRFTGVLSGTVATAIVQSSSVITVMLVSFVNVGLMNLNQAIAVIMGAHIGTTITAQIIAFNIQAFALLFIALGGVLRLFVRTERLTSASEGLFGLGIVFYGMQLMTESFIPLHGSEVFRSVIAEFSLHPWSAFLVGTVVTLIVQSSAVTTGIIIALAFASQLSFQEAVPIIFGLNVGTTITANMAAIGGSRAAKQGARAHFLINALGALLGMIFLTPFISLVRELSPEGNIARQVANAHTYFNILTTIIFLPFISVIARLSERLLFSRTRQTEELYYLETSSLEEPETALDQVKIALIEMHTIARNAVVLLASSLVTSSEAYMDRIAFLSAKLERYQIKITEYMDSVAMRNLARSQSRRIPKLVRILHEIERIQDYIDKLREVAVHLHSEGRELTQPERAELKQFFEAVTRLMTKTNAAIGAERREVGEEILRTYERLAAKKNELRNKSQIRYTRHRTHIALANYYYDVISSLEEIAKKCRNIAFTVLQ